MWKSKKDLLIEELEDKISDLELQVATLENNKSELEEERKANKNMVEYLQKALVSMRGDEPYYSKLYCAMWLSSEVQDSFSLTPIDRLDLEGRCIITPFGVIRAPIA